MGTYSRTFSLTDGTVAYGSQVAFELDALGSSCNNIVNAQISSGAAIADSKLAQITTGGKVSGAALTLLTSIPSGAGVIPIANIPTKVMQVVNYQTGSYAACTTAIPADDTIPQKTEGDEVMTLAITPTSATNKLKIDVVVWCSTPAKNASSIALFQDTTDGALAAGYQNTYSVSGCCHKLTHYMDAGTTSETTFKVRLDGGSQFNGEGGVRIFGGVSASSITITEIKV